MSLDSVRFSRLRLMGRSPAHYAACNVTTTAAMDRGTAVHAMLFGGREVMTWEEGRPRRGKDFDKFQADHPDALILPAKEYAQAQAIAVAVKSNPLAARVLDGELEVERAWKFGDRACAGRLDVQAPGFITDLKVTNSAQPDRLQHQADRMGWFAQLAWYLDGVIAGHHGTPEAAYIVAVEPLAPFAVTVGRVNPEALDKGRRTYRLWLEMLLNCEASDSWPAYAQSVVDLRAPEDDVALDFGDAEAA